MKKMLFSLIILVACLALTVAGASPSVSDGETTGWIGENNYLFVQGPAGTKTQLPMAIIDLIGTTDEELICMAGNRQMIAVKKNGTGSRIIDDTAISLTGPKMTIAEGVLYLDDLPVSDSACASATDSIYVYYVEREGSSYILRTKKIQESNGTILPLGREDYAAALSGTNVNQTQSITVTKESLILTGTNHQITVFNLLTGDKTYYPAASDLTTAACIMNGKLYCYKEIEEGRWILESETAVSTSTPEPTVTPAPTPMQTENSVSYIDDDGTIHYGAYGKKVRKIQERLSELGYPIMKIDGKYGKETQMAIDLFCDAIHVKEHNYITRRIQNKLFAKDAPAYDPYLPLKRGDQGVSVRLMQTRLKELGYDPGKVDGIYGKNTVAAVALFQQDYGIKLEEKEKPGEVASHEMMEMLYGPDITPVPAPETTPTTVPTTQTDL